LIFSYTTLKKFEPSLKEGSNDLTGKGGETQKSLTNNKTFLFVVKQKN